MDTLIRRNSTNQIVPHQGWRATRDALLDALRAGPGFIALLGPPGTGKSMMLQEIARALLAEGMEVTLLHRGDAPVDPELTGVVLIDEADRTAPDALAALASRDDLAIVAAALPGFADRVQDLCGVGTVTLSPLDAAEASEFVTARLKQSGHAPDLLTPSAVAELFRRSGGVPRVLHTLLGLAIFAASLEGALRVTPAHVTEAVVIRDGEDTEGLANPAPMETEQLLAAASEEAPVAVHPEPRRRRWVAWAVLVGLLLCLGASVALLVPSVFPPPSGSADVPPSTKAIQPIGSARSAALAAVPALLAVTPGSAALLPTGSLVRVVLSYPTGDTEAARRGADVARRLRADGATAGDPVPVAAGIAAPALLYYFAQDHDGAAAIGRKLDGRFGEPMLARLPPRSPLPRPGTIELMLAASDP